MVHISKHTKIVKTFISFFIIINQHLFLIKRNYLNTICEMSATFLGDPVPPEPMAKISLLVYLTKEGHQCEPFIG